MKNQRQNDIIKLLLREEMVRTDALANYFNVSMETIRRDINDLQKDHIIEKFYGGIRLAPEENTAAGGGNWNLRAQRNRREKEAIAAVAIDLIPDGSTVALDIGTTIFALACLLGMRRNLTILTNSIKIPDQLLQMTEHRVYTTGGLLRRDEMITTGAFARSFLDNFSSLDLFICGADGITFNDGITEFIEGVVDIKNKFVAMSSRVMLLADHTKFGQQALFRSCRIEQIDIIVTDSGTPAAQLDPFRNQNITVVVADLPPECAL